MKSTLITLLKLLLPVIIIAYLISRLEPEQVTMLREQPKNWGLLISAFVLTFVAVSLSFARWWLLVWSLGLPFRLIDAFRLGFLGYLMNFVSAGAVGGDLFKAVFIAREQPGRRAEAVATVIVDRVVGLYALLLVASAGILMGSISQDNAAVRWVCRMTLVGAAVGAGGIGLLLSPVLTGGWVSEKVSRIPWLGPAAANVMAGIRLYKSRPLVLVCIAIISIGTHVLLACVMALIAHGLFDSIPPLMEHFVIVPLAMIANALPLTPGGLGALEVAMDELYRVVPATPHAVSGVLVALVYRITTFAIAGVGVIFYIRGRKEVEEVMHEAEALEEEERSK